jgi:hypothetical protein
MGEMSELCCKGDAKMSWDKDNLDEVKTAEKMFDDLVIKKNYLAFAATKRGKKTTKRIYSFDALAERIVLVPPVTGG